MGKNKARRNKAGRGSGLGRLVIKNRLKGRQKVAEALLTEMPRKLLKLTNAERTVRYFGAVRSIEHVKRKGIKDFPSEHSISDISLVLDEDGTIIDNDDYLMAIPDETVIMILKPGEVWQKRLSAGRISGCGDFVDAVDIALTRHITERLTSAESDRIRLLASRIHQQGLAAFVTFSNDDILLIAGMPRKDLAAVFGISKEQVMQVREACQKYATQRQSVVDAIKGLKTCQCNVTVPPEPIYNESDVVTNGEIVSYYESDRLRLLAFRIRHEGLASFCIFTLDDLELIAHMTAEDITTIFGKSEQQVDRIQDFCYNLYKKRKRLLKQLKRYKAEVAGDAESVRGNEMASTALTSVGRQ